METIGSWRDVPRHWQVNPHVGPAYYKAKPESLRATVPLSPRALYVGGRHSGNLSRGAYWYECSSDFRVPYSATQNRWNWKKEHRYRRRQIIQKSSVKRFNSQRKSSKRGLGVIMVLQSLESRVIWAVIQVIPYNSVVRCSVEGYDWLDEDAQWVLVRLPSI